MTKKSEGFKGVVSLEDILNASTVREERKKKNENKPTVEEVLLPPSTEEVAESTIEEEELEVAQVTPSIPSETAPTPAPQQKQTKGSESYKVALRMLELGLIKDHEYQVEEGVEEGTSVSKFLNMTADNLKEIVDSQKADSQEDISSKYISKEGLKEHELKVIEILKNGGDLSQIAKTEEEAFQRPFEGFTMDSEDEQAEVRYAFLVQVKNLDPESAETLIDKEIRNGTISKTGQHAFDAYRKSHADYVDAILEKQVKAKEHRDFNFKENKKALTSKYKEAGLKESAYKKVVADYSKRDEKGEYNLITKLREVLDNPEENHEVILHLADKTLFDTLFKIKASNESSKAVVRLKTAAGATGNKQGIRGVSADNDAPWLKFAEKHNSNIKY